MIVLSRKEAAEAGLTRYFTGKSCPKGHVAERHVTNATCVQCTKGVVAAWQRANREYRNEKARQYQQKPECKSRHSQWLKSDRAKDPEKYTKRMRRWYFENKARSLEMNRLWGRRNSGRRRAAYVARTLAKQKATPWWLTDLQREEMVKVYVEARRRSGDSGVQHHVDHIVPIQSDVVCGLHVPWNLRITTASENSRKKNMLIDSLVTSPGDYS